MLAALLIVSAVLPSLLLVWFFHARDTFPEPPRVLWATFGLGIVSVVPAVALGLAIEPAFVGQGVLSAAAFDAFVIAALCEEGAKLAVLLFYSFRHSAFDEPMDGIVYGATAALGFAALENVMYVADGGVGVAVARAFLSVPGHATYGAVMGYYVGRARFDAERRWRLVGTGLFSAVLLHGFYDFPLMALKPDVAATGGGAPAGDAGLSGGVVGLLVLMAVIAVAIGWTWSLRLVARARAEQRRQPLPPAAPGPAAVVAMATAPSAWRTRLAWGGVLLGGLVACAGGMVIALGAAALAFGEMAADEQLYAVIGIVAIGGVPFVIGLAAFGAGILALNRAGRAGEG
jgi:RsiW-degrading membrane proteinase PrsW (M82 family)